MLELVDADCKVGEVAADRRIGAQTIYKWRRQDPIDQDLAALCLATAILIVARLINWRDRWSPA